MCTDKNIKEMLPAYLEQALSGDELLRVEEHLKSCEDCSAEVSLLQTMMADSVPDPGEAFWNEMPGRVYRAVQREKAAKKRFDLSWLLGRTTLPRWVFAAATMGLVLVISWSAISTLHRPAAMPQEYVFSDESMANNTMNITALNQDEMDAVSTWTGKELASIAEEAEPLLATSHDTDIEEELSALNATEIDALSNIISNWNEEV